MSIDVQFFGPGIHIPLPSVSRTKKREVRRQTLRVKEAAEYLGVSPWTLRNYVHDGRMAHLPGKVWRFVIADLDKFLAQTKETKGVL